MKTKEAIAKVTEISHQEWLDLRKQGIGGSDAATIIGLNPYSSPYYLYCEKMGEIPQKLDSEAMRQGRDLEQYVADRWNELTGKKCRKNNYIWRSVQYPFMMANIDREVVGENAGLECKTTTPYNKHDFSGGEIPLNYYVQCQHYMAVMGYDKMYLAILVLGKGFYTFEIVRDEQEIQALVEREQAFFELLQTKTPPPLDNSEATQTALSVKYPNSEKTETVLTSEQASLLSRYDDLQATIKDLKSECDGIKCAIMEHMGTAEKAVSDSHTITWSTRSTTKLDSKAIKTNYPEIFEKYATTTESRTFTVRKRKMKEAM